MDVKEVGLPRRSGTRDRTRLPVPRARITGSWFRSADALSRAEDEEGRFQREQIGSISRSRPGGQNGVGSVTNQHEVRSRKSTLGGVVPGRRFIDYEMA